MEPAFVFAFSDFALSSPPFPPPSRNTQRCGGFETRGIGRRAEYRSDGKCQRGKWTTAEPHGT